MKKLLTLILFAIGAITLLDGCSSGVERLGVQVHLTKLERTADGSFLATLRFGNPNVGSINIAESTHQLSLNGKPASTLKISSPLGIPAQQTVTTTATLKPNGSTGDISGTLSYRLSSLLILAVIENDTEKFKTQSTGTVVVP